MTEEIFRLIGPVMLGGSGNLHLSSAIGELLPRLPKDAQDVVVIVHMAGLLMVKNATIDVYGRTWPVRFDPSNPHFPQGSVVIGYGLGNLESFSLPNVSENELETL